MTEKELFDLIWRQSPTLNHAMAVDTKYTYEVLDNAVDDWNRGYSFVPLSMILGTPRVEGSEEELNAMVKQVCGKLEGMIMTAWVTGLSREEAATLVAVLPRFGVGGAANCGDIYMDARDISLRWNDTHPDQEGIYPEPAFEN